MTKKTLFTKVNTDRAVGGSQKTSCIALPCQAASLFAIGADTDPVGWFFTTTRKGQNNPSIWPSSLKRMFSAEGTRGRPGMVMISPQTTTPNPAPALSLTSRTETDCPVGAPRRFGFVVKKYCVLGHAIRQVAIPLLFPQFQLIPGCFVREHVADLRNPVRQLL